MGGSRVHIDDVQPEEIPGSDDSTTTQGSLSPAAVDLPSVGPDEPGSGRWLSFDLLQRSHPSYIDDSPIKAHVGRKQRRQQLAVRSHSEPVASMAPTVPVFNPRIDVPGPGALRRAFSSYDEVHEALVSAFDFLKDNASNLDMSKLVAAGNLLSQTSTTVFGAIQKQVETDN